MDRQEFESPHYQRVYQYLQRHTENIDLDRFSYANSVEGTSANWLKIILQWVQNMEIFSVPTLSFRHPSLFVSFQPLLILDWTNNSHFTDILLSQFWHKLQLTPTLVKYDMPILWHASFSVASLNILFVSKVAKIGTSWWLSNCEQITFTK